MDFDFFKSPPIYELNHFIFFLFLLTNRDIEYEFPSLEVTRRDSKIGSLSFSFFLKFHAFDYYFLQNSHIFGFRINWKTCSHSLKR